MTIPFELIPIIRELLHEKCGVPRDGAVNFGPSPGQHGMSRPCVDIGRLTKDDLKTLYKGFGFRYHIRRDSAGIGLCIQYNDEAAKNIAQLCLDHKLVPTWMRKYAYRTAHDHTL